MAHRSGGDALSESESESSSDDSDDELDDDVEMQALIEEFSWRTPYAQAAYAAMFATTLAVLELEIHSLQRELVNERDREIARLLERHRCSERQRADERRREWLSDEAIARILASSRILAGQMSAVVALHQSLPERYQLCNDWSLIFQRHSDFLEAPDAESRHLFCGTGECYLFRMVERHFTRDANDYVDIPITPRGGTTPRRFSLSSTTLLLSPTSLSSSSSPATSSPATLAPLRLAPLTPSPPSPRRSPRRSSSAGINTTDDIKLLVYPWSRRNNLFQSADADHGLWMGSGENGHYGLFVDKDFDRGTSARCTTFDNDGLASTEQFEVRAFEVWAIKG